MSQADVSRETSEARKDPKRVPLLSALIHEGLKLSLEEFMKLSKDEQISVARSVAEAWRSVADQVRHHGHSIQVEILKKSILEFSNAIIEAAKEAEEIVATNPVAAVMKLLFLPSYVALYIANDFFGILFDILMEMFIPSERDTYEVAVERAKKFVTIVGDLNSIGVIFDFIGKTRILGSKIGCDAIGRLITNIGWTFGLGWLTWVAFSPVFRYGIAYPIERELRRRVRDRDLTISQLMELLRRMTISLDQFREKARELGYPEDGINYLIEYSKRLLTVADLRFAYESGRISEQEFLDHLARLGYRDDDLELKFGIEKLRAVRDDYQRFVSELEDHYVRGYLDRDELAKWIEFSGSPREIINYRLWRADYRAREFEYRLKLREIERAFIENKIDEAEAVSRLSEFIKRPEIIERYIALWELRRKPERIVDPFERAKLRYNRIRARVDGLRRQISYLKEYLRERMETYAAMEKSIVDNYNLIMERIRRYYEARINAVKAECNVSREKSLKEIQLRIADLESDLRDKLARALADFKAELGRIKPDVFASAGVSIEEIIDSLGSLNLDQVVDLLLSLLPYCDPREANRVESLLRHVESLRDVLERIELLKAIAEIRVEEREARCLAIVERLRGEMEVKLNQIRIKMEDRIRLLRERADDERIRIERRIDLLRSRVEEYSVELSTLERMLKR